MHIVTQTQDLTALCGRLAKHDFVTVDTEFMRERTYYPKLCLIQVASTEEAAIIDPLAAALDLAPFLELLADPSVLKVFHAARQDLEIFYKLMGKVPAPLFDTQIAAMACGHGDQVGYEALIREVTGAQVDKGSRFTDWAKRPLSDKQLTYALGDVTHLVDAYQALITELEEKGRLEWIHAEMTQLNDPTLYYTDPDEAWRRIKVRNLKQRDRALLKAVAAWREREAIARDTPRNRVMKDDGLMEIVRTKPKDAQELAALRAIPSGFERSRAATALFDALAAADRMDEGAIPPAQKRDDRSAPADVLELLRVLLKRQSEMHRVAPKLLASAADLEAIALNDEADVPALSGWRREVFGEMALKLKHGRIALALDRGSVRLIDVQG